MRTTGGNRRSILPSGKSLSARGRLRTEGAWWLVEAAVVATRGCCGGGTRTVIVGAAGRFAHYAWRLHVAMRRDAWWHGVAMATHRRPSWWPWRGHLARGGLRGWGRETQGSGAADRWWLTERGRWLPGGPAGGEAGDRTGWHLRVPDYHRLLLTRRVEGIVNECCLLREEKRRVL